MKLPEIGHKIDTSYALELCDHFKLDYLVKRIKENPDQYKSWAFDGVSCLPDKLFALCADVDQETLTWQCALPHDLCYGYGEPKNDIEKARVDLKFYSDLVTKAKMDKFLASALHAAVQIGGGEELGMSFSWGFARKR